MIDVESLHGALVLAGVAIVGVANKRGLVRVDWPDGTSWWADQPARTARELAASAVIAAHDGAGTKARREALANAEALEARANVLAALVAKQMPGASEALAKVAAEQAGVIAAARLREAEVA